MCIDMNNNTVDTFEMHIDVLTCVNNNARWRVLICFMSVC